MKGGVPTVLSIDWLNGFLYLLEDPYKGPVAAQLLRESKGALDMRRKRSPEADAAAELDLNEGTSQDFENVTGYPALRKLVTKFELETVTSLSFKWNIWRTNLMGEFLELVMGDLKYEPKQMQVDPYNGCGLVM